MLYNQDYATLTQKWLRSNNNRIMTVSPRRGLTDLLEWIRNDCARLNKNVVLVAHNSNTFDKLVNSTT